MMCALQPSDFVYKLCGPAWSFSFFSPCLPLTSCMDISALCSTSSEERDALPSPHSPASPHRPEVYVYNTVNVDSTIYTLLCHRDARALEPLDRGGNSTTQPTFHLTPNVQLPKLRYPTSATATPTPNSIHEYLPVPSVNSSNTLHDTSKTSPSPSMSQDTTESIPPCSTMQSSAMDLNQVCSWHLFGNGW